jgi:autotransporter translocation and assembly factor TamB
MALINMQDMDISGRGSGNFNFYGRVDNPHLNAEFSSDSLNAYGMVSDSVDLDLNLRTFATKLDGKMRIWSGSFHYADYDGDSIFSEVVFDSNLMIMDTIHILSERLDAELSMNVEFTDSMTRVRVPALNMKLDTFSLISTDTISIAYSENAVRLRSLNIKTNGGMLEAEGGYFQNDSMDFSFSCSDMNLEPIFDFYIPDEELAGIFGFNANMSGTPQNPRFSIQGTTDSLEVYGNLLGNMYFDLSYSNSMISVDSLYIQGDSNMMRVTGTIPYNLAFTGVENRLVPDATIDLEVGSRVTSYYLLPVILPDIEWMEGDNALDLKVGGTPNNPEFSGNYYLRGGRIKVYYLQDPLENVNADISFEGRDVVIEKIETTRKNGSKKRIARATGTVTFDKLLSPIIDIHVTADDFPIKYDLGEIEAVIDEADINVKGQDTITATGSIRLASLRYSEPLAPEIETGAIQASDTASAFNYILDITAPSNIIIEGPDFTVELSGDLRVFKQGSFTNFYGRMETIRGEYNLFGQRFEILEGGELVFDDIEEFNPRLNIVVETYLMAQGERLTARILISGTLQEPKLSAAEGSQVSENQFYEYMTFQRVQGQGEGASTPFGQRITEGITDFALGRLSRYFGQQIGLDVVELNPAYEGEELSLQQSRLKVGMYTTPGLFIYGTTQLDFSRAHEVGFEYRLSRHFYLSGHRDEGNLYHLNVNLDWNF